MIYHRFTRGDEEILVPMTEYFQRARELIAEGWTDEGVADG